ncbi:hypothetical protein ROTAS13_04246 [Roseomonas sp. TAS13]|nr:hypothetical protein ROTAS13_04246 [Roseomonas sp. TAS13]
MIKRQADGQGAGQGSRQPRRFDPWAQGPAPPLRQAGEGDALALDRKGDGALALRGAAARVQRDLQPADLQPARSAIRGGAGKAQAQAVGPELAAARQHIRLQRQQPGQPVRREGQLQRAQAQPLRPLGLDAQLVQARQHDPQVQCRYAPVDPARQRGIAPTQPEIRQAQRSGERPSPPLRRAVFHPPALRAAALRPGGEAFLQPPAHPVPEHGMGGGQPGEQHGQPQQQRRGPQPAAPGGTAPWRGLDDLAASGALTIGHPCRGIPGGGIPTCLGGLPCAWRVRAVLLGIHATRYSAPPGRSHDP